MRHTLPLILAFLLAAPVYASSRAPSGPATLDDGPGAGGGYGKRVHTLEDGPGSGGGYGKQVPTLDDGPGAGGGYGKQLHVPPYVAPPSWRSLH